MKEETEPINWVVSPSAPIQLGIRGQFSVDPIHHLFHPVETSIYRVSTTFRQEIPCQSPLTVATVAKLTPQSTSGSIKKVDSATKIEIVDLQFRCALRGEYHNQA
jgi:hypothetical protein